MSDLEHHHDSESDTITRSDDDVREPSLYKVVLLNDDFTPMDFVVELIISFFQKSHEEATKIMLNIHHKGSGICGTFPREIAETKVTLVNQHSRKHSHPLKCRMEKG